MRRGVSFAIKLLVSMLLVGLLVRKIPWEDLQKLLSTADRRLLGAGLLITLLNFPIGAARWYILLRPLTRDVSYLETLRLVLVAHFFNVFVPGGIAGDVVRGLETRRQGLVTEAAFGSVVTDRLMALVAWVIVGALGFVFSWRELLGSGIFIYVVITNAIVLVLVVLLYSRRIGQPLVRLAHRGGRLGEGLGRLLQALHQYRGWRGTLVESFGMTIVSHFCMILSIYVLALGLGAKASFASFVLFVPVITIIATLPVTWGGLGLRDAGFVILFPTAGMTQAQALGTSLAFLATVVIAALVGGLVYLWPARSPAESTPITSASQE